MPDWPSSLPQTPLISGDSETLENNIIFSQMDQGPAKYRRRFTAGVQKFTASFVLTSAQVTTFKTFFDDSIAQGASTFTFTNPRTDASETFRIDMAQGAPQIQRISAGLFRLTLNLERMP